MCIDRGNEPTFDAVTNPYRPWRLSFDRHDRTALAIGIGNQSKRLDVARRATWTARAEQRCRSHDAIERVTCCHLVSVDTRRNRKRRAGANSTDPKTKQHAAHDGNQKFRQGLCNLAADPRPETSHTSVFKMTNAHATLKRLAIEATR